MQILLWVFILLVALFFIGVNFGMLGKMPDLEAIQNPNCGYYYKVSSSDFQKIPGSPIAFWVSEKVRGLFENLKKFENKV